MDTYDSNHVRICLFIAVILLNLCMIKILTPPPNSAYHAGAEFLIYGDYPLKLHKSYTDQVALLKSRGLIIHDDSQAAKVLETVNYYRLSGYLHEFKKDGEDCYIDGLFF